MIRLIAALFMLAISVAAPDARAECNRQCKPGQTRDAATGCCLGTPTPPPNSTPNPKPPKPAVVQPTGPKPCQNGMERGADTAGQCCWPGQAWSSGQSRCIGKPVSCPSEFAAKGDRCEQLACGSGKQRSRDTAGRCCWPGQVFSTSQTRCLGAPTSCPDGFTAGDDGCQQPIEWVSIPGGSFAMGADDSDASPWEKPIRRVTLSPFRMARTETTVGQYAACVAAGRCSAPSCTSTGDDHPVACVDWQQSKAFCQWSGGRLPTEAEWEYAARGDDGRKFPWGNQTLSARRANCAESLCADGFEGTSPVGSFPDGRSPFGLDDMVGNVWEWVSDWFDLDAYESSATSDPTGPSSGSRRVSRGGSFYAGDVRYLRAALRYGDEPSYADAFLGFRCARSP